MWYDPFIQGLGPVFGVPALLGTGFFLFRLMVSGAGLADGHIADHTGHADTADAPATSPDSHDLQKPGHSSMFDGWITLQSAFSWLMGFGWSGLIGYAVPVFWLALLMVMFFSLDLGWLPSSGQISLLYDVPSITGIAIVDVLMSQEPWREAALHDALRHLVLPSLVLAVVPTTEVIRHVRSSLIDVMKQNYIKAAASRGLSRRQIVWRHGLKNALPPVLPLLGLQLGSVLTSAMITEVVFEWHGIGRWLISSIALQDYAAIRGATLVVASFVILTSVSTELLTTLIYPARRKELYAKQD